MKDFIKIASLILTLTLFASVLFSCAQPETNTPDNKLPEQTENTTDKKEENTILGQEGNIKFDLVVVHKDGAEVLYKVETTKDTLEGALLEGSIGSKENNAFVKIDGEKLEEGARWEFYKDTELLTENPSNIPIANGDNFRAVYTAQ